MRNSSIWFDSSGPGTRTDRYFHTVPGRVTSTVNVTALLIPWQIRSRRRVVRALQERSSLYSPPPVGHGQTICFYLSEAHPTCPSPAPCSGLTASTSFHPSSLVSCNSSTVPTSLHLSSPISSPVFSPQKEYKDCVLELRDECATWLIEYLDNVRLPVVLYWLFVQQV